MNTDRQQFTVLIAILALSLFALAVTGPEWFALPETLHGGQ